MVRGECASAGERRLSLPLDAPIAEEFARFIAQTPFRNPDIPVVANVTARPLSSAEEIRALLEQQTYSPVRWVEFVQYMADQGVTTFLEIGPGKVLSGL